MLPTSAFLPRCPASRAHRHDFSAGVSTSQRPCISGSSSCVTAPQFLRPVRQGSSHHVKSGRAQTAALGTRPETAERAAEAQAADPSDFRVLKKHASSQHHLIDTEQEHQQHHGDKNPARHNGRHSPLSLEDEHAERVGSNHRASTTDAAHRSSFAESSSDELPRAAESAHAGSSQAPQIAAMEQATSPARLSKSSMDTDSELEEGKSWELVGYWRRKPAAPPASKRRPKQLKRPPQHETK